MQEQIRKSVFYSVTQSRDRQKYKTIPFSLIFLFVSENLTISSHTNITCINAMLFLIF